MQSLLVSGWLPSPVVAVTIQATPISERFGWLTNSILVAAIVLTIILWLAKKGTKNMTLVPHRLQNFFELIVEFLYNQVEAIVGKKHAPKAFPLLATIFLFVLVANWLGLFPGVGTVGFGSNSVGPLSLTYVDYPLFRPATADLNMTLGIALCFMLIWFGVLIKDVGIGGFLQHTFMAPGSLKKSLGVPLFLFVSAVFMVVGFIELISIAFRPASLSLRLFGNVYAGETLLHSMMTLSKDWGPIGSFVGSVLIPIPFYFLELLVGLLQAVVFSLLCAVYIQLLTGGDDHGEEAHH